MAEEVFNPDTKKEVVGGIMNTLIFIAAIIIEIAGLFVILQSSANQDMLRKIIGNVVWLAGSGLMVWIIVKNFRTRHGQGFKIANAVIKIIIQFISIIFFILVNTIK